MFSANGVEYDLESVDGNQAALLDGVICGPHCDSKVLHAPGECSNCDRLPLLQKAREILGINFTGHYDDGKIMCPSEYYRTLDTINRWHGNRPRKET